MPAVGTKRCVLGSNFIVSFMPAFKSRPAASLLSYEGASLAFGNNLIFKILLMIFPCYELKNTDIFLASFSEICSFFILGEDSSILFLPIIWLI